MTEAAKNAASEIDVRFGDDDSMWSRDALATIIDRAIESTTADLRAKLADAEQREAELHTIMAACLPHWIDPEAGVPLTDAATFRAVHDIALRLEAEVTGLREGLGGVAKMAQSAEDALPPFTAFETAYRLVRNVIGRIKQLLAAPAPAKPRELTRAEWRRVAEDADLEDQGAPAPAEVPTDESVEPTVPVVDIMQALKESLATAKRPRGPVSQERGPAPTKEPKP